MKRNIIINGDSISEMNQMSPNSVDLIFVDPPYWMRVEGNLKRVEGTNFAGCDDQWDHFTSLEDYEQFTTNWLKACQRILKPNGAIWVIGGMQCIYTIGAIMQKLGFWIINDVVWHKKNPTPNFMGTRLNNSHETLIWATKSKNAKYTFNYKIAKELNLDTISRQDYLKGVRKQLGSVWKIAVCSGHERLKNQDNKKLHNTQKPIELLEKIIAISSKRDDLILDPFAGTMTTAAAAKKLGRDYIMIEKDQAYCLYGQQRLDQISFIDNEIANAIYDKKPLKVSLVEMIKSQFLHAGESFYLKTGERIATLRDDGKLWYQEKIIDIHTCAAKAKNAQADRLNGFDHWYVMRDQKRVLISELREQYRQSKLSK